MYYLDIFHLVIFGGEFSQHIVLAGLKSKTITQLQYTNR